MEYSFVSVFIAGVATLLTPCILPMLPIYLSVLLGASLDQAKDPRGRFQLLWTALLFVFGFALVFTLMGLGASTLGGLVRDYRDVMLLVGGLLIVVFGLKYLGLLRITALDRSFQVKGFKTGYKSFDALLFGIVFALGWTPCVGPILGSVLTYTATATSSPLAGAAHLFAYSMGVGLPLLVISLLADRLVPQLRKLHRHLPKFEKATGLVMLAVGLVLAVPVFVKYVSSPSSQLVMTITDSDVAISPPLGKPSEKPRLVEFYGKDCPVCKKMAPRFNQLKQDCIRRGVEILTVDISDPRNGHVAKTWKIQAIPTIKMFGADGSEKGVIVGDRELQELRAAAAGLMDAVCMGQQGQTEFEDAKPACQTSGAASSSEKSAENPSMIDTALPTQCAEAEP